MPLAAMSEDGDEVIEYPSVSRSPDQPPARLVGHSRLPAPAWDASDEAMLAGLGTGDPTSASVFVRRFQSRVHGVASAIVGDGPNAAEVSQEAFLRAWRHADAYDPRRGSVVTWLLAITRNLAIDRVRMARSRPSEVLDALALAERPSAAAGPEDVAVVVDEAGRVSDAVARLPEELRRALLLASVGGYTAKDVAEHENIPLGTAKTRIRTALRRVRDGLSQSEETNGG